MTTAELNWRKTAEIHRGDNGLKYSVDRLLDIIASKPRGVESFLLEHWYTARLPGPFGSKESVLFSSSGTEHTFSPKNLLGGKQKVFPVILCKRGRSVVVIDGIHRIVKAIRAKRKEYSCVYVTLNELKQCVVGEKTF
jgi:hypothetical protein